MKIKFIDDGNIAGWARLSLIGLGLAMFFGGLAIESLPKYVALVLIVLGIPVSAIGGYASRAKALGLKPFDNSYRKARDSYKAKDDEEKK
ncbi:conserved hypothetical protein [Paraburkholderia piptadeniae]|uniref:Transmembrane protein n=1 Tax=Paraburkholderia piptadeniae TaxID=1701573 RepID=A0A1N7SCK9_9BURK|nr:hypothetical protein [Paraburkholderia piptadeniae]SIT45091.1 conserved hypothetical protein [Paraburkholderia piptadeniae]